MQPAKHRKGGSTINKGIIQRIKSIIVFLSDKRILLGIGIGLILATVLMMGYKVSDKYSKDKIEAEAREMGMHYKEECRVTYGDN